VKRRTPVSQLGDGRRERRARRPLIADPGDDARAAPAYVSLPGPLAGTEVLP